MMTQFRQLKITAIIALAEISGCATATLMNQKDASVA